MKRRLGFGTVLAFLLGTGVAGAAPLNYEGTLIQTFGNFPALQLTGGGVATVTTPTIPANAPAAVALAASRGVPSGTGAVVGTAGDIRAVVWNLQPGTGSLFAPGEAAHTLPIAGVLKICLLSTTCNDSLTLLLTQPTTGGPGTAAKGVGIGGTVMASNAGNQATIDAAPWTIKTATVMDGAAAVTKMGFAHGPASGTTSTAQPSGVVQVVTPSQIRTNLPGQESIGAITTLIVHFVPEPGMLLLLGSGIVGLGLLGRTRMRK